MEVACSTAASNSLMDSSRPAISLLVVEMVSSAAVMRVAVLWSLFFSSLASSSVLSISALQKATFSSSSFCSSFREAIILSTRAATFSNPSFLPRRAIMIRSAWGLCFKDCRAATTRWVTSERVVFSCSKDGDGRVFLNRSRASSEFNILMVSAIATSSSPRVFVAASCSLAVLAQSSLSPARNPLSAARVDLVSLRSPVLVTTSTARSPARADCSSMAAVEAVISLFLAATMPL
mmetsp:Transcript_58276/g.127781  ORF Transcript_58276/g.127781 Transcript_58276/m.127781 type:complete len:235 (-) Transcript_58276:725-1429(-)